jgi:hypothetical protein
MHNTNRSWASPVEDSPDVFTRCHFHDTTLTQGTTMTGNPIGTGMWRGTRLGLLIVMLCFPTAHGADLIPFGSNWIYLQPQSMDQNPRLNDPAFDTTWFTREYDVNGQLAWSGPDREPFAYGDPGGAQINAFTLGNPTFAREANTFLTQPNLGDRWTTYFRHEFTTTSRVTGLGLELLVEDGGEFYLDGVPLVSFNCCAGDPDIPVFADVATMVGNEDGYSFLALDNVTLEPGEHLMAVSVHQWSPESTDLGFSVRLFTPVSLVSSGETWKYFKGRSEPSAGTLDWTKHEFDDSAWLMGEEGIGYESGEGAAPLLETRLRDMQDNGTNRNPYGTVYLRKDFAVDDPNRFQKLSFAVDYDDGFIAYINGTEVARSVGSPGEQWPFDAVGNDLLPPADHESTNGMGDPPRFDIDLSAFPGLLNVGSDNVLAVQGINSTLVSSDFVLAQISLTGIPRGQTLRPGDFDLDGDLDAADVDALVAAIASGSNEAMFDLDLSRIVDVADLDLWVRSLKKTWYGDTDLDGEFNTNDLILVFQRGEYQDGVTNNSTWGDGDWNGDLEFTSGDFVTAFRDGGFEVGPRNAMAQPVPEPVNFAWTATVVVLLGALFRNRFPVDDLGSHNPDSRILP